MIVMGLLLLAIMLPLNGDTVISLETETTTAESLVKALECASVSQSNLLTYH